MMEPRRPRRAFPRLEGEPSPTICKADKLLLKQPTVELARICKLIQAELARRAEEALRYGER